MPHWAADNRLTIAIQETIIDTNGTRETPGGACGVEAHSGMVLSFNDREL